MRHRQKVGKLVGNQPWTTRSAPLWTAKQDYPKIDVFMEAKMEDDKTTSAELRTQADIKAFSANISVPTIGKYIRKRLEWVAVWTRFGPR